MRVSYNRLWKKLIDLNLKRYQLREMAHISNNTMAKLGKNEFVNLEILSKICECLDCDIEDVCQFVKDSDI